MIGIFTRDFGPERHTLARARQAAGFLGVRTQTEKRLIFVPILRCPKRSPPRPVSVTKQHSPTGPYAGRAARESTPLVP
jgi:hypothetical protein